MRIAERMMAQVEVQRNGETVYSEIGLNEIVIKSGLSHLLRLKTHIAGMLFATYLGGRPDYRHAHGFPPLTPCPPGGPLVHPDIEAFVIVPE